MLRLWRASESTITTTNRHNQHGLVKSCTSLLLPMQLLCPWASHETRRRHSQHAKLPLVLQGTALTSTDARGELAHNHITKNSTEPQEAGPFPFSPRPTQGMLSTLDNCPLRPPPGPVTCGYTNKHTGFRTIKSVGSLNPRASRPPRLLPGPAASGAS